MINYNEFKKIYNIIPGEPEFEIYFKNRVDKYMIIKYVDYVTFQRCGIENGSGEFKFSNLDNLVNSKLVDGINLKDDWNLITDIIIDDIYSVVDDKSELYEYLSYIKK